MVFQVVISGLATGMIYSLVALGIVIIYKATNTINFAQGDIAMFSAFIGFSLYKFFNLPLGLTLLLTLVASAILGLLIERIFIRPAINAPTLNILIITIGISIGLRSLAGVIWGHDDLPYPSLFSETPIDVGLAVLSPLSIGIICCSIGLMLVLFVFFKFTKMGIAMRAVSQSQRAASLMGVSVKNTFTLSWVISCVIGAIGGVLIAPVTFLSTKMGFIVINALIASILGGFGSLPGAIIGGMLLGVIENISPYYLPAQLKYSVPFLILILVLLIRPSGILQTQRQKKV
jgi:branched-chain amino acid transport system permease protein